MIICCSPTIHKTKTSFLLHATSGLFMTQNLKQFSSSKYGGKLFLEKEALQCSPIGRKLLHRQTYLRTPLCYDVVICVSSNRWLPKFRTKFGAKIVFTHEAWTMRDKYERKRELRYFISTWTMITSQHTCFLNWYDLLYTNVARNN